MSGQGHAPKANTVSNQSPRDTSTARTYDTPGLSNSELQAMLANGTLDAEAMERLRQRNGQLTAPFPMEEYSPRTSSHSEWVMGVREYVDQTCETDLESFGTANFQSLYGGSAQSPNPDASMGECRALLGEYYRAHGPDSGLEELMRQQGPEYERELNERTPIDWEDGTERRAMADEEYRKKQRRAIADEAYEKEQRRIESERLTDPCYGRSDVQSCEADLRVERQAARESRDNQWRADCDRNGGVVTRRHHDGYGYMDEINDVLGRPDQEYCVTERSYNRTTEEELDAAYEAEQRRRSAVFLEGNANIGPMTTDGYLMFDGTELSADANMGFDPTQGVSSSYSVRGGFIYDSRLYGQQNQCLDIGRLQMCDNDQISVELLKGGF